MAVSVPPPMSSAASGSRSFEVACVVGVVSWDGRGIGKGHVCDVECGAGVLAVFVAGAGADRLEGVARRVPDDGPGKCAVGSEESAGVCGGALGSRLPGAAPSSPRHAHPSPTRAPIFAHASGPGFHCERAGVTQWPVHHLHLPHDQPHPPYLALCPPLVAADRPKNPAKLIEESGERLQGCRRRDCPGERLPGPEKICRLKPMSLREVLGEDLAGNCGFPRGLWRRCSRSRRG